MTNLQQAQVTFNPIRGGRFSVSMSPKAAQELADAIGTLAPSNFFGQKPESQRAEQAAMQQRFVSGGAISLGDSQAVVRFRPLFEKVGPEAARVLDEIDAYIKSRHEAHGRRSGAPANPLFAPVVIPPRPASPDQ